jgi:ferric-dicitrate binding protein FerR (iron transport regulator)
LKKDVVYHSADGDKFSRYLERKKHQSKEDQYFEAGVLISELETVDTNRAYFALHSRISSQPRLHVIWARFSRIAAILIFPLLIYTIWDRIRDDQAGETGQLSYQEISSPSGMRSKVVLPDGSQIWLNAESRIRYSIPFVRETRELELVGEAFLDVMRNPDSPLEVKFNQVSVRVLGTQFNVKAFPEDEQMEVVLKEGSISVHNESKGLERDPVILKPDQQWVYDKTSNTASLKKVDADRYIAWHRNRLILDKTPMAEVAKQLERWYGIKVEIKDKELYKYKFTTVFENEPLHRVIELLEMSSPIRIRYIPGELNKETGETEKSIIQINDKS